MLDVLEGEEGRQKQVAVCGWPLSPSRWCNRVFHKLLQQKHLTSRLAACAPSGQEGEGVGRQVGTAPLARGGGGFPDPTFWKLLQGLGILLKNGSGKERRGLSHDLQGGVEVRKSTSPPSKSCHSCDIGLCLVQPLHVRGGGRGEVGVRLKKGTQESCMGATNPAFGWADVPREAFG